MATIKKGNLIDALLNGYIDFALHNNNCRNSFKKGIAREFMERIPKTFEVDTEFFKKNKENPKNMLGKISLAENVINLYGQLNYGKGRQVDYGAYASSLAAAISFLKDLPMSENENLVVGLPYRIASDNAGGDWNVIKEITEGMFDAADIQMVWYQL